MIHQSHESSSENFKELHWDKELRGPDQAGSGGAGGFGGAGGSGGSGGAGGFGGLVVLEVHRLFSSVNRF